VSRGTKAILIPLLLAVLLSAGCASRLHVPKGWLPTAEETQTQAHGAWIRVEYGSPEEKLAEEGELLAVDADTVFIASADTESGRIVAVPMASISEAVVKTHATGGGSVLLWTLGGTISTISHGYGLLLTAPVWVITGSLSAVGHNSTATSTLDGHPWSGMDAFKVFARFPQGMPPDIDRSTLCIRML
jgi:hypothetical protein